MSVPRDQAGRDDCAADAYPGCAHGGAHLPHDVFSSALIASAVNFHDLTWQARLLKLDVLRCHFLRIEEMEKGTRDVLISRRNGAVTAPATVSGKQVLQVPLAN